MSDTEVDELGPVDYIVVECPADKANFSGEMGPELSALVERGVVRVLDLLFLRKHVDSSVGGLNLTISATTSSASCVARI